MQTIKHLSYDELRNDFIEVLKQSDTFRDYNFDASGISTLLNLLTYNAHLIGFYVRMALTESFVDSAKLKQSMLSHAKLVGYIYQGKKSAIAELFIRYDVPENNLPENMKIIIPKGTIFENVVSGKIRRSFVTNDDFILTNYIVQTVNNETIYSFINETNPPTPLVVYEGKLDSWKWLVQSGFRPTRYIIEKDNVDISTLKVRVYETESAFKNNENYTTFQLAKNLTDITSESNVFYISTSEDGYYEIFFGQNVFGKDVKPGNVVVCEFIVCNGAAGNNANGVWNDGITPVTIVAGRSPKVDISWWAFRPPEYQNYYPVSYGGLDEETVEDLRFNIPHFYSRQQRLVNEDDYKSIILNEYRDIDSIVVWGGEKNIKKDYGKVYVAIKPKFGNTLSLTAKNLIKTNIISKFGTIGSDIVFVDPSFIYVHLDVFANYDKIKTDLAKGQIETKIESILNEYNNNMLGSFDVNLSEVDMMTYVMNQMPFLKSIYSKKTLRIYSDIINKNNPILLINFANSIVPKTFKTNTITLGDGITQFYYNDYFGNGILYAVKLDNTLYDNVSRGTINYSTGEVKMNFPIYIKVDKNKLISYAIPENPDINSYLNNILLLVVNKVTANG